MSVEVGQRFEVVEVLIKHPANNVIPIGWQSVCTQDLILSNCLMIYSKYNFLYCSFTMWPGDTKKIGTLKITRVKSQEEMAAFQERYKS